jgi:anthranilate phosphoribosyltransferase
MTAPGVSRSWPHLLTALLNGADLDAGATSWAMEQIMGGEATPAQVAGFAIALRAKGETAAEVAGLAETMLTFAKPVPPVGDSLDIVGSGGDQSHTVNISTMAALIAAAAGARVTKHGNRAASSSCGAADVLEAIGVAIDLTGAWVAIPRSRGASSASARCSTRWARSPTRPGRSPVPSAWLSPEWRRSRRA